MTKQQILAVASALITILVLYFGCDTKPRDHQALEKSRALAAVSTTLEVLVGEAKANLAPANRDQLIALESEFEATADDSLRASILKELAGMYYSFGFPAVSGGYAERVAAIENSEESWSIAGTTYAICVQREESEKIRNFCTDGAVNAFESAISLNPANLANRVNLALVYTKNPPPGDPMKGIGMLLDLNSQFPESVLVLNNLARLALQTGQNERAVERLEDARGYEPENEVTICLLAQAYGRLGETEKAKQFDIQCRSLQGGARQAGESPGN